MGKLSEQIKKLRDLRLCDDGVRMAEYIAIIGHYDKTRRDGVTPYIEHPKTVAARVKGDSYAEMVAWLHDVIEDTDVTVVDLIDSNIPSEVIDAVVTLTKGDGQSYEEYITEVKTNPLARKVKIADMLSNLTDTPTDKQIVKYAKGLLYLVDGTD